MGRKSHSVSNNQTFYDETEKMNSFEIKSLSQLAKLKGTLCGIRGYRTYICNNRVNLTKYALKFTIFKT